MVSIGFCIFRSGIRSFTIPLSNNNNNNNNNNDNNNNYDDDDDDDDDDGDDDNDNDNRKYTANVGKDIVNIGVVTTPMFTLSRPTFAVYFLFLKLFFGLVTIYFDPT